MIITPHQIKIITINEKAKKQNAVRFDKGSPSPLISTSISPSFKTLNTYPPLEGIPTFIENIKSIEFSINKRLVTSDQICITNGAFSGITYTLSCLLEKGDIVLTNYLTFEGFTAIIKTLGLVSIEVDYTNQRKVEKAIQKHKPKALILNSPENPSGKIYNKEELSFINNMANKYHIFVLSDEVNNQNTYPPYIYIPPSQYISANQLISINSFSKNYFLAGLRLGWIVATPKVAKRLRAAFSVTQVAINPLSQIIAVEIVKNAHQEILSYKKELLAKKSYTEQILKEQNLEFISPVMAGAVFFIKVGINSEKLANNLLKNNNIGVVPGSYFGKNWTQWIRLGFGSVTKKEIEENIPLIKKLTLQLS